MWKPRRSTLKLFLHLDAVGKHIGSTVSASVGISTPKELTGTTDLWELGDIGTLR